MCGIAASASGKEAAQKHDTACPSCSKGVTAQSAPQKLPTIWKRLKAKQNGQALPDSVVTLSGPVATLLPDNLSVVMSKTEGAQEQAVTANLKGKLRVPDGKKLYGFAVDIRGHANILGIGTITIVGDVDGYNTTYEKRLSRCCAASPEVLEEFSDTYIAAVAKPPSRVGEASFDLNVAILVNRNDREQDISVCIDSMDVTPLLY